MSKKTIRPCFILMLLHFLCAFYILSPIADCADEIFVVTTVPDLADMAGEVGGELVRVKSIAGGNEDMHSIPMKPSYLIMLNRADVLIEVGLDNEHAWLPDLLYNCRNDEIQPGAAGFINCSAGIEPLEKHSNPDRMEGMVHPEGNPHYNLDPGNAPQMVRTICEGLCRAYPGHANVFKKNRDAYIELLESRMREWEVLAQPLEGVKVVTYHRSWSYFVERFGIEVVGEIEPKPGIPPSARHLVRLIRSIEKEGAELVIREPYFTDRYPRLLEEKTGITCLTLPNMSGGTKETSTYIRLIDHNIKAMLKALGKPVATAKEISRALGSGNETEQEER